jgi:molybdate transport system substrate-binding protein
LSPQGDTQGGFQNQVFLSLPVVIYVGILPKASYRKIRVFRAAAFVTLLALLMGAAMPAMGAAVTVFAAASLKEAMDEQAKRFESVTGNRVILAYGGSNALARQIEAGAPAEVFLSADEDWMDYLDRRRLLVAGTRSNLLSNELVLIASASSRATLRIAPGFGLATALGGDKLAMANPDSAPAGKYGKSALESLGVWKSVEKQVVRTDNVRAALALVARGEAAFGIVYKTDALAERSVRIVDTFLRATHAPIVYPAALVAPDRSPAAKALLDFLRSGAARLIWEKYGFAAL